MIAYRLAEDKRVMLPVMVCMDGFILTHGMETVDVPEQDKVNKFLPKYKPEHAYLDTKKPMSLGTFTDPSYYMDARYDMELAMERSQEIIAKAHTEFSEIFGRDYDFVEKYRSEDADVIIVAMGSISSTIKDVVDELRDAGEKVGQLHHIPIDAFD